MFWFSSTICNTYSSPSQPPEIVNCGIVFTVTVKVVLNAHCPELGVKVYTVWPIIE